MTISYRYWRPDDDAQLWPMIDSVGWLSEARYADKFNDAGLLEDSIVVAETDGEVVGHCLTAVRTLLHGEAKLRFGNVGQVLVKDSHRGQGIGAQLYARTVEFANRHELAAIWLVAHPTHGPAYEMYRRRGFEVVQGRMAAIGRVGRTRPELVAQRALPAERGIISDLRRAYAATTSGVEDRNTDVSNGTAWHLIRDRETPVAAAAVRYVDDLWTISSLLYATGDNPTTYVDAVASHLDLDSFQIHGSPHGHLVNATPELPWEKRSGENLIYIASLDRLCQQLSPFLQARGRELGLGSARMTISAQNERVTLEFAGGEIASTDARPGDSELNFAAGGLPSVLFGTRDIQEAVAEGTVQFNDGGLDLETASAWLSPFDYCDFTQLAGW
jgi:predicted N-acetyltransferase YhbS